MFSLPTLVLGISSIAVENLVCGHPAVQEAAVIGVTDAKWGERPLALVVLREGQVLSSQDLRDYLMGLARTGAISRLRRYGALRSAASTDSGRRRLQG